MVADCQVQGVCAWAVVGVDVVVCVCACLGICTVVPCIVLAGILIVGIMCTLVDCKIEGVNVDTGRAWLGMVVGIDATFRIILTVPVVFVASGYVVRCVIVVCYCEM